MSDDLEIVYDGSQLSTTPPSEESSSTVTTLASTLSDVTTTVLTTIVDLSTTTTSSLPTTTTSTTRRSTHYPPPPYIVASNGTSKRCNCSEMPEWDSDIAAYGVITAITVAVLIIMLYMALFGKRMQSTALRWHVINCSFWGIVHMAHYSSFAEKAPFPHWIQIKEWRQSKVQVECFMRSVFPAGMFFVLIERMLLVCAPKLADKSFFNGVFFFFNIIVVNVIMVGCFYMQFTDYEYYYNPIELFNIVTYVLMIVMFFLFFVFCIFGACCCCCVMISSKKRSWTAGTFVDMWLMLPYTLIALMIYGPSFGITAFTFGTKMLMTLIVEHGLLDLMMGAGGGGGGGGGDDGGDGGGGGGMPIDINVLIDLLAKAISAMPWFVLVFPLVHAVMTILCVRMFREQFFFLLTCGRCFGHKKLEKEEWTVGGVAPCPVYPAIGAPPLKVDYSNPA